MKELDFEKERHGVSYCAHEVCMPGIRRGKAQRVLGRMFLRNLRGKPRLVEELEGTLGVSPLEVAEDFSRRKAEKHNFTCAEKMIRRIFGARKKLLSRAFNLAYAIYDRSSQAFRRLPQRRRKYLRNSGRAVLRPSYSW